MKRIVVAIIGIAVLTLISCQKQSETADYQVVPLPKEVTLTKEKPFILDKNTVISYPKTNEDLKNEASFLADYINDILGFRPTIQCTDEVLQKAIN